MEIINDRFINGDILLWLNYENIINCEGIYYYF